MYRQDRNADNSYVARVPKAIFGTSNRQSSMIVFDWPSYDFLLVFYSDLRFVFKRCHETPHRVRHETLHHVHRVTKNRTASRNY